MVVSSPTHLKSIFGNKMAGKSGLLQTKYLRPLYNPKKNLASDHTEINSQMMYVAGLPS
jgi:hypothetical protein